MLKVRNHKQKKLKKRENIISYKLGIPGDQERLPFFFNDMKKYQGIKQNI